MVQPSHDARPGEKPGKRHVLTAHGREVEGDLRGPRRVLGRKHAEATDHVARHPALHALVRANAQHRTTRLLGVEVNLRDVARLVPGAVGAYRVRRRRQQRKVAGIVRVARELGVAVALLPSQNVGLRAVLSNRLGAEIRAHHAGEVERRDPSAAGVHPLVHRRILARRRRQVQLTELATQQEVVLVVVVAVALAGDKIAPTVPVAVVCAVRVLASLPEITRGAVTLPGAVVTRPSARALRLDLTEQAEQVPLARVLRSKLLGEITREFRDASARDGVAVKRIERPRRHGVFARGEHDVRDAFGGRRDGELVAGDGPWRRRVAVRGAEPNLGDFPPHRLVERLEKFFTHGHVDVFTNQISLRAGP